MEDQTPSGAQVYDTWVWDTAQKASGTSSHTQPAGSGYQEQQFVYASSTVYVASSDNLVTYVLLNPCSPPREIMIEWHEQFGGWAHGAYWGEDLIDRGDAGTPSKYYMGPLPAAGEWTRLEIPATAVGLQGLTAEGMLFAQYDGQVWWDHSGKISTCTAPVATVPSTIRADTVWVEDGIPGGAENYGFIWDTTQKVSGTSSHALASASGDHDQLFFDAPSLSLSSGDKLVTYVLLDPCDPPREIMLEWLEPSNGWEHRAFWGDDLINRGYSDTPGRVNMGPLPLGGQWVRLEVPVETVDLAGISVNGTWFHAYAGAAWFDRSGKSNLTTAPVLTTLGLLPTTAIGGHSTNAMVVLDGPAPSGGTTVTLSSSNGTVAQVPSTVVVSQGSTFANFQITTASVSDAAQLTIGATLGSDTRTSTLTVISSTTLSTLTLAPSSVLGGGTSTGTVTLTGPAPSGGASVTLSSSNASVASVPATATVAAGDTSGTFTVTTTAVSTSTPVTISATYTGLTLTATQTVTPIAPSFVSLNPSSVSGGSTSTGTVTLNAAAPSGGAVVALSSANSAVASVPSTVTVAAGNSTADFTVTTYAVESSTSVAISGSLNGISQSATLTVTGVALSALSLSPTSVVGGTNATGTVTLTMAAPSGGSTVSLSSSNSGVASVPSSVTIASGATTATFTITTGSVSSATAVDITASRSGVSRTVTLTVATCVPSIAAAPSSFPNDVVWVEDQPPAGAQVYDTWIWDTGQKASGASSHTQPAGSGYLEQQFVYASSTMYVAGSDKLVTYVLVNPCSPTREIMLQWHDQANGWAHGAYWGENLIDRGQDGTASRYYMGSLPTPGVWTRLEVPASTIGLQSVTVEGMLFANYKGQVWFDHSGKIASCTMDVAAAPSSLPADTVWFDDAVPAGAENYGFVWDTTQKVSGTKSHTMPPAAGYHEQQFFNASVHLEPETGDKLVTYVLLNPCDPPREVMVEWHEPSNNWEHRAYWGEDLINQGTSGATSRQYMGPLPEAGQWVRLEVPESAVALGGHSIEGMLFALYNGQAWFDRSGKSSSTAAPTLTALTLSPSSVQGGTSVTGTVTLSGPAPTGGTTVSVSSDNSAATVPATVTVPSGTSSANFSVSTSTVGTATNATISGVLGSDTRTTVLTITVAPVVLTNLTLSLTTVIGGNDSTGTVTLGAAAPSGGTTVTLSSNNAAATVPASVTVPQGATTATFTVATLGVSTAATSTISATYSGVTQTAALTVNPAGPSSLSLSPGTVVAGNPCTATITLSGNAPTGGATVTLSSSNTSAATVPATVTIAAGATSATFTITTLFAPPSAPMISAVYAGNTRTAILGITAALWYASVSPATLVGPASATGSVTLTGAAPAGGAIVTLTSSNTSVATIPASVTVAAGATFASFTVTTFTVASSTAVTISGTYSGLAKTTTLTVQPVVPVALSAASISPATVGGGSNATFNLVFNQAVPSGGVTVGLSSSNTSAATVPASVNVAAGLTSTSVNVATAAVTADTPVTLTATYGGIDKTAALTVQPFGISSLTLNASTTGSGTFVDGTVFLNGAAPAGGIVILLTATGDGRLVSPISGLPLTQLNVTVPQGSGAMTFETLATWRSSPGSYTITGTYGPTSKSASATVQAGSITFNGSSSALRGGTYTGTMWLTGGAYPYPPAGYTINVALTSSDPSVLTVPATVTATEQTGFLSYMSLWKFTLPVPAGAATGSTQITLTYLGASGQSTFNVLPSSISSFAILPSAVPGSVAAKAVVTLDSPAPSGGAVVAFTSSDTAVLPNPGSVTIPAGQTSGTLFLTPSAVGATTLVTVTATYQSSTRNATLKVLQAGAAQVTGIVLDARVYETDKGLPGVMAGISGDAQNTTLSDTNGAYTLYVDPGAASVVLSLTDFASQTISAGTLTTSQASVLAPARLLHLLVGPYTIRGIVKTTSGTGIAGASGTLEGYQGTFTTDAGGAFTFACDSLLRYRLTFQKSGYPTRSEDTYQAYSILGNIYLQDFTLDSDARPVLSTLSLYLSTVTTGQSASATVTISGPAPSSGARVSVSSTNPAAVDVATYALVPGGSSSTTFALPTQSVTTSQTTIISAYYGGVMKQVTLTVVPHVVTIALSPATVIGVGSSTGTVTLSSPAPAGGATVALGKGGIFNWAVAIPASVSVPSGSTTGTFTATTGSVASTVFVDISATYQGDTSTATLRIDAPTAPSLSGVAPGWVLPGDTTPVIYGNNLQSGSSVVLSGPVYSLTDIQNPLCVISPNACPQVTLAGAVNTTNNAIGFVIPSETQQGIYHLKTITAGGQLSSNNQWIAVDTAQVSRAEVSEGQKSIAKRIYPGQTVTGSFSGNNPLGAVSDYDYYYFVATAGSRINISMQRAETSMPWENPASLDPQIEVIAPDGFIYENLQAFDNVPVTDLNASLTNAVLPLTGLYIISAETTRGSGAYALSFSFSSVAPAAPTDRAVPQAGNFQTAPLNTNLTATVATLDPRGYPLAGASVTFATQSSADDHGTIQFVGGNQVQTTLDGAAVVTVKPTAQGAARYLPSFDDPTLASGYSPAGEGSFAAELLQETPRYRPVGRSNVKVLAMTGGQAFVTSGEAKALPVAHEIQKRKIRGGQAAAGREGRQAAVLQPAPVGPAAAARPISRPSRQELLSRGREPAVINSCSANLSVLRQNGVTASQIQAPFTMTLTDISQPTSVSQPLGLVNTTDGIHDYRIEKTLRLKLDIKDASGSQPTYPVLVSLSLGGPYPGTLTLDPEGNRVACQTASFIWHEKDAQGNLIASNEEFEYKLGTYAPFVGVVPDPNNQGHVKAVYGEGEALRAEIFTPDADIAKSRLVSVFPAHPLPGKPDHFVTPYEFSGNADDNFYEFWTGDLSGPAGSGGSSGYLNDQILLDRYNNIAFGYTNTSTNSPSSTFSVTFTDQTLTGPDFESYGLVVSWNGSNQPSGNYSVPLTVNFTDLEWGSGTVTRNVTMNFISGSVHALVPWGSYETRFGVNDGTFPISVSPSGAAPTTSKGDGVRRVLLAVTGTNVPAGTDVFEDPHQLWQFDSQSGVYVKGSVETPKDPKLEVSDRPEFRVSVVDFRGQPVTDVSFKVHRCPRFDHEGPPNQGDPSGQAGRPCSLPAITSDANGAIASLILNEGASDDNRGYMGVELLRAPKSPGTYYVYAESLGGNYRVWQDGQLVVDPLPAGEFKGAFALCTVQNVELLDESFTPVHMTLNISFDRAVYLREVNSSEPADSYASDVVFKDYDTQVETTLQNAMFRRLGKSSVFLTDLISIVSPDPPLAIVVPGASATTPPHWSSFMARQAMAGTVLVPAGRSDVERRHGTNTVKVGSASSKVVTIASATSNFSGVPLASGGSTATDHIEATVQWGADGYVAVKVLNVNDQAIFTFETFGTSRLTTDLAQGLMGEFGPGLSLSPERRVAKSEGGGKFPLDGALPLFKAVLPGTNPPSTLTPGLYKIRAKWSPGIGQASATIADPNCDTDHPEKPVCVDDWIVSVGERILLAADQSAMNDLNNTYFPQVYVAPRTAPTIDQYLTQVAVAATQVYVAAGANVVISTDLNLLHPRLTHRLKSSLPLPDDCSEPDSPQNFNYGCTNNAARFPLADPDLDLASGGGSGINLDVIFRGLARGPSASPPPPAIWAENKPKHARNTNYLSWSTLNPAPDDILLNRIVNLVSHETAHGFGLVSGQTFLKHGAQPSPAKMSSVSGAKLVTTAQGLEWRETPDDTGGLLHEPLLDSETAYLSDAWLMTAAPYKWNQKRLPSEASFYDTPATGQPPQNWLLIDRRLRFSMTGDWTSVDKSIQQFFRERLPLCTTERICR